MACEERFGVRIPDEALEHLRTVGDAVDYIAGAAAVTAATRRAPSSSPGSARSPRSARTSPRSRRGCSPAAPACACSRARSAPTLPARLAATVDLTGRLERVEARTLDRVQQLALVAAREAWADAGSPEVEPERLAVVIGSGIGGALTMLGQNDVLRDEGPRRVSPHLVPMLMPNGPAATVGLEIGARAGVHTPVSACASGAEALALALDLLRSGRADVVVAGGAEACVHPLPLAGFAQMRALSTRHDEPEAASRPYDKGRDGFVLGEGAGRARARDRGARRSAAAPASTPASPAPAWPATPTT